MKKARVVAGKTDDEFHIGYAPSLTIKILPRALQGFQEQFPRVKVVLHDLSTEEMLAGLRQGKLHIALTIQPQASSLRDLVFQPLARYPICVALPPQHPLSKSKSIDLAQLVNQPLIGFSRADYPESYLQLKRIFAPVGWPRVVEEHDGIVSVITAVESGRGFALVSEPITHLTGRRVRIVPLKPKAEPLSIGAIWKKSANPALIIKFITGCLAEK